MVTSNRASTAKSKKERSRLVRRPYKVDKMFRNGVWSAPIITSAPLLITHFAGSTMTLPSTSIYQPSGWKTRTFLTIPDLILSLNSPPPPPPSFISNARLWLRDHMWVYVYVYVCLETFNSVETFEIRIPRTREEIRWVRKRLRAANILSYLRKNVLRFPVRVVRDSSPFFLYFQNKIWL